MEPYVLDDATLRITALGTTLSHLCPGPDERAIYEALEPNVSVVASVSGRDRLQYRLGLLGPEYGNIVRRLGDVRATGVRATHYLVCQLGVSHVGL